MARKLTEGDSGEPQRVAYRVSEVARALGVSAGLVRLEIARGNLGAVRVGRRVLIHAAEFEAFVSRAAGAQ